MVSGRGRLTGRQQWCVSAAGKVKVTPKAPPPWHRVKAVNWIVGQSLERIKLLQLSPPVARDKVPPLGTKAYVLAKPPTPRQFSLGCDRCSGNHRKSNTACAATLGIPTPMSDPTAMYDAATGEKLPAQWTVVSESILPRAKVATRVYERIR